MAVMLLLPSDATAYTSCVQGAQGPIGTQGATGATGATGAMGATGPVGPEGRQGPAGVNGTDGMQGAKGDTGAVGQAGSVVWLPDVFLAPITIGDAPNYDVDVGALWASRMLVIISDPANLLTAFFPPGEIAIQSLENVIRTGSVPGWTRPDNFWFTFYIHALAQNDDGSYLSPASTSRCYNRHGQYQESMLPCGVYRGLSMWRLQWGNSTDSLYVLWQISGFVF